jgi:hypothetical protein
MRSLDWLLLLGALAALIVGVLLNGPICEQSFGPNSAAGCDAFRFPAPIAAGVALAAVLVATLVVRRRARKRMED